MMRPTAAHLTFWGILLFAFLLCEGAIRTRLVSPAIFAAPSEILMRFPTLFSQDQIHVDIFLTLRRTLCSVALGFPGGVLFAVGLYLLGSARSSGEFVLDFIRSIPITSLLPLFIAIVGVGESSKVAIGAAGSLLMTATTVWVGIRHSLHRQRTLLYLYEPTLFQRLTLVLIPANLATLLAAVKLSVSAALVLVIVSEMFLGSRGGLGKVINDMSYGDDRAGQFACVIFSGIMGFGLNIAAESLLQFFRPNSSIAKEETHPAN